MNLHILKDSSELIYYNNPSIPIYVRKGDLYSFTNNKALCHWHDDIEFLLPISGKIEYQVNGKSCTVNEDEAIFINSRQMHYGQSINGKNCQYICIVINPLILFPAPLIVNQYVSPILESDITSYLITKDNLLGHQLIESIRNLYKLYASSDVDSTESLPNEMLSMQHIYEIWNSLYNIIAPHLTSQFSHNDPNIDTLKKIISFIYDHYNSRITLSDISKSGHISTSKCCKLFNKYLNSTPNTYLNTYRIEKSLTMLRDHTISITEIAYSCGFSNPSYFSEIFTSYKGCSPSKYRSTFHTSN